MRLKAVKLDDYSSDKGLHLDVNTSSVWQFLVTEGGSLFLTWLKPNKEYVKPKIESKVGFSELFAMLAQGGSESEEKADFTINNSVCAYGVSLQELEQQPSLIELGVPIFVSVDLSSLTYEGIVTWLESQNLNSEVTYVLNLGLNYVGVSDLTTYLAKQGYSEDVVRLIGECVFKYKGQNYCGLFSPNYVKKYNLEWVYDSEPHKASQVFLCEKSTTVVPIEDCVYTTRGGK